MRTNARETIETRLDALDRRYRELDAQNKCIIVTLGDIRRLFEDHSVQLDNRFNQLQNLLQRTLKTFVQGDPERALVSQLKLAAESIQQPKKDSP